jgi:WhiB family redox-sensing transcriptional regulator
VIAEPYQWRDDAACLDVGPDWFFPEKGHPEIAREGLRICRSCPVAAQCLQYALENDESHGIWGGILPQRRRRMRRVE